MPQGGRAESSDFRFDDITIPLGGGKSVSGLLGIPSNAVAGYVMAHGAGAGMRHAFMDAMATDLAAAGIATLRYDFPYMQDGRKRPDPPNVAKTVVRAAVKAAGDLMPGLALFAGGKSFGGRMTSQAQASEPLAAVRGLIFLGFPLHPAKQPSATRGEHLSSIGVPMLFLQGERDALAEMPLLKALVDGLGQRATAKIVAHADHSFHVPARSGRSDPEVRAELAAITASWIKTVLTRARTKED
jgi:predicted alpha/beta-hydrolase family hydrolase